VLLGILQTPHRFRTKRQLWTYGSLAIETHSSADYGGVDGQLQRAKKRALVRGLNVAPALRNEHSRKRQARTIRDGQETWPAASLPEHQTPEAPAGF
jgi:transposase